MKNKHTLTHKCPFCGTERQKEFNVQDTMPNISADDREFFITGICPDCWDKYLGGGEDDV